MTTKRTNVELIQYLMASHEIGELASLFVMEAVWKHAVSVSEMPPAALENVVLSPAAWQHVARQIKSALEDHYANPAEKGIQ